MEQSPFLHATYNSIFCRYRTHKIHEKKHAYLYNKLRKNSILLIADQYFNNTQTLLVYWQSCVYPNPLFDPDSQKILILIWIHKCVCIYTWYTKERDWLGYFAAFKLGSAAIIILPPLLFACSSLANWKEETGLHKEEEHTVIYLWERRTRNWHMLFPVCSATILLYFFFGLCIPCLPKYTATPWSHHQSTASHEHLRLVNYDTRAIKCGIHFCSGFNPPCEVNCSNLQM